MDEKETKGLLLQYRDVITKLREGGIIRSGRLVSDYGEYLVCKRCNLKRADSSVNKGYDAIDKEGLRYEIKSRKATAWNKPTLFPITKEQLNGSDFVVLIEFDNDWNIVRILKIPTKEVKPNVYNRVYITKRLIQQYSLPL